MQPWQQTRWQQETSSSCPRWDPRLCFLPRTWLSLSLTTVCCYKDKRRYSKIDSSSFFLPSCIPSQSFSILSKSKWTGVKADFQATERKMTWLVLDGSQMNECIFDFDLQWNEAAATWFTSSHSRSFCTPLVFQCQTTSKNKSLLYVLCIQCAPLVMPS